MAEYKDMAKVDAGMGGTAGAGITGAFKIRHESGKFVIYAKLGACLGLGGEVSLKFETGYDTIYEFFKCVSYQLKRIDFNKITDAIEGDAYAAYCQIKYMVIVGRRELASFVGMELFDIISEFN
ncbi:hypothetical protein AAKU55_005931 [Oxalobacteraceae bacterium GrIS 1.11]